MDRRALLASGSVGPGALSPIAWWYASAAYVQLTGATVLQWSDRSGNGNHVIQTNVPSQPDWDTSSWGGGKPALAFSGVESLSAISGTAISSVGGTNVPFSLLVTFSVTTIGDNCLCSWDNTTPGNAQVICRLDNPSINSMRFVRTNDAGTSDTDSGTTLFGANVHTRAAYVYDGSTITTYLNGARDINAAPTTTGALTLNRFRIGDGPGASDSFQGLIVEALVVPRAITAGEASLYYRYSLSEWG